MEIRDSIEQKEHEYSKEMSQVNKKYNEIIEVYQNELHQLKGEIEQISNISHTKESFYHQEIKDITSEKSSLR